MLSALLSRFELSVPCHVSVKAVGGGQLLLEYRGELRLATIQLPIKDAPAAEVADLVLSGEGTPCFDLRRGYYTSNELKVRGGYTLASQGKRAQLSCDSQSTLKALPCRAPAARV
jgi:hypothetical protein